MRHALYFTPAPDTAVTAAAAEWLGRDAFTGEALEQPVIDGLPPDRFSDLTTDPRRYGFHATLKPPFALADGRSEAELDAALSSFAAARAGFSVRLKVARISGFLALVPDEDCPPLGRLADDCVIDFEPFRAPLSASALARRRSASLSERQDELLATYGYPYVLDQFRFHMTLSSRLEGAEADRLQAAAEAHFAGLLDEPVEVRAIARFTEASDGAPFRVGALHPFHDA